MDIVQVRPGASKPDYIPESEEEVMRAFHYALERCDLESVDWPWVLFETVSNDRHELVKELLDNNYVDVNDTDDGEMSALMAAARDSDLAMVELLLDYGADPFYMTAEGETALDYALKDNNREISDYLKEYMGESIKRLYLY